MSLAEPDIRPGLVPATLNYCVRTPDKPQFHAQDHRRDNIVYEPRPVLVQDGRALAEQPSLMKDGFALVHHKTAVTSFHDREQVAGVYLEEIRRLILELTGAKRVEVMPGGGMVRYSERSPLYGTGMNTGPARFPHVDWTPRSAPGLVANDGFGLPKTELQPSERLIGYNIWRPITPPPQDVPLALCDPASVDPEDLIEADGVYDAGDPSTWWRSEAYVLGHNPRHRWIYWSQMGPQDALVFRAYDNLPGWRAHVPHYAFDDPTCPPGVPGRESVEARAYAVFDS